MSASVTAFYASIPDLLVVALGVRVTLLRRRYRIGVGASGNETLRLAIRAHANAIEYIPIGVLLLLCLELNGGASPGCFTGMLLT